MAKGPNQKLKLLYLADILLTESDENHPLSTEDLISRLEDNGITAERKSIYDDIRQLEIFGYDIVKGKPVNAKVGYYIGERDFELAELKLLADAVASSKFITEKKSAVLIGKLGKLTSKSLSGQIKRHVFVNGRVKTENESIYYNVDSIHNAIISSKQISFKYFRYSTEKNSYGKPKKIYRGQLRTVSPYSLAWDNENYYLLAYDETHCEPISSFRVDKMEDVRITDIPVVPLPENVDIKEYCKNVFGMYAGDKMYVRLRVDTELVGVLYDRFGKDISVLDNGDGTFNTHFETYAGPPLIGWIMQFSDKIEVLEPKLLRSAVCEQAKKIAQIYSDK